MRNLGDQPGVAVTLTPASCLARYSAGTPKRPRSDEIGCSISSQ